MKISWMKQLGYDPLPALLAVNNEAINFFARRDLMNETPGPVSALWDLPAVSRLVRKQQPGGFWDYPAKGTLRSETNYNQLETYRNLGFLVEKFGLNKKHATIREAAAFLFSCQSGEGDFRGIYGNQYSPNYSAGIMELLIKAGYGNDPHVKKGFDWLLSIRQDDGGWAIPLRTRGAKLDSILESAKTLEPDRTRPFSHLVTGVVLRAFAAHPRYRCTAAAKKGARLLSSRFFQKDKYTDRGAPEFWGRCAFPFWFTDIVSSLDSLSRLSSSAKEPEIANALKWLVAKQEPDGLFGLKLLKTGDRDLNYWLCLAICRIFKRFYA